MLVMGTPLANQMSATEGFYAPTNPGDRPMVGKRMYFCRVDRIVRPKLARKLKPKKKKDGDNETKLDDNKTVADGNKTAFDGNEMTADACNGNDGNDNDDSVLPPLIRGISDDDSSVSSCNISLADKLMEVLDKKEQASHQNNYLYS